MADLKTAAKELVKALEATDKALQQYYNLALAIGRETGDATERGFGPRQVRERLWAEVVARLSPKRIFGTPEPVLQLDGAPEARRYVAAHPLPGLS